MKNQQIYVIYSTARNPFGTDVVGVIHGYASDYATACAVRDWLFDSLYIDIDVAPARSVEAFMAHPSLREVEWL